MTVIILQNMNRLAMLGMGAEGSVYLVERAGKNFALKVLHEKNDNLSLDERLKVTILEHPGIVRTYESTQEGILMEYFDGETLERYVEDNKFQARQETSGLREYAAKVLGFIAQVGEGLMYAKEKGVEHHDIKPANILVKDGTAKITDFSSSYTENYAAPEVLDGKNDEKSAVYALGMVLCEALTERPIFPDQAALFMPREYKEFQSTGIAEELSEVLEGMLQVDVRERNSMKESVEKINSILDIVRKIN